MLRKRPWYGEFVFEPVCDGCGAELPEEYEFWDALAAVRAAGWGSVPPEESVSGAWEHFCPACRAVRDFA